jgi:hypothetical protein
MICSGSASGSDLPGHFLKLGKVNKNDPVFKNNTVLKNRRTALQHKMF